MPYLLRRREFGRGDEVCVALRGIMGADIFVLAPESDLGCRRGEVTRPLRPLLLPKNLLFGSHGSYLLVPHGESCTGLTVTETHVLSHGSIRNFANQK